MPLLTYHLVIIRCAQGKYSDEPSLACKECAFGKFNNEIAQGICKQCAPGNFVDQEGQKECKRQVVAPESK